MPRLEKTWTPEEDARLKRLYLIHTNPELESLFHTSAPVIRKRAKLLGLSKGFGTKGYSGRSKPDNKRGTPHGKIDPKLLRKTYDFDLYAYHAMNDMGRI